MITKRRQTLLILFLIVWIPGFYLLDRLILTPEYQARISFEGLLVGLLLIGIYQTRWLNPTVYRFRGALNILSLGLGLTLISLLDHFVQRSAHPLGRDILLSFSEGISLGLMFQLVFWLMNRNIRGKIARPLGRPILLEGRVMKTENGDADKVFLLDDRLVITSLRSGERPVLLNEISHLEVEWLFGFSWKLWLDLSNGERLNIRVPMPRLWMRLIYKLKNEAIA